MLNPITRLIEMYRDVLIYGKVPGLMDLGIVIFSGIVLLILGSLLFGNFLPDLRRRYECSNSKKKNKTPS